MFVYLHEHGEFFHFSESRQFALDSAGIRTCDKALIAIDTILKDSNPDSIALSSRLYKLVAQFANRVHEDSDTRAFEQVRDTLLPSTASYSHSTQSAAVDSLTSHPTTAYY